jgi:hypothetical protein
MADVIVIRLHPKKPTTGAQFTTDLTGLTITLSEMSVSDPKGTAPAHVIGTAFYDPTNSASRIVQDLMPPFYAVPAAAATAVIDVGAFEPPGYAEYQTSDVRLTITRGTQKLVDTSVNYNVPMETGVALLNGDDPGAPFQYASFTSVALYLALPTAGAGVGPGQAFVDVPSDGSPPNYDALLAAVTTVLNADPGAGFDIKKLTVDQCRHIAYEIVWNRALNPLPSIDADTLAQYYTSPGSSGHDTDRQQFESNLVTYSTTSNTQADTLAKYVYALSAALQCEQLSKDAKNAGFAMPILPGAPSATGKVADTDVILS